MRVADTSIWIELITKGPLLEVARTAVTPLSTCITPAIVHYELVKWCSQILRPEEMKSVLSLLTETVSADMGLTVAHQAARLSLKHKLHATDAIVYATACVQNVRLYTCDSHFKDLPHVEYFEK